MARYDRSRQVRYILMGVERNLNLRPPRGGWCNYTTARTLRQAFRKAARLARSTGMTIEIERAVRGQQMARIYHVTPHDTLSDLPRRARRKLSKQKETQDE